VEVHHVEYRVYKFKILKGFTFPKTGFYVFVDGEVTKKYNSACDGKEWRIFLDDILLTSNVEVREKVTGKKINAIRIGIEKKTE